MIVLQQYCKWGDIIWLINPHLNKYILCKLDDLSDTTWARLLMKYLSSQNYAHSFSCKYLFTYPYKYFDGKSFQFLTRSLFIVHLVHIKEMYAAPNLSPTTEHNIPTKQAWKIYPFVAWKTERREKEKEWKWVRVAGGDLRSSRMKVESVASHLVQNNWPCETIYCSRCLEEINTRDHGAIYLCYFRISKFLYPL